MLTHRARCIAITTGMPDFIDLTDDIQAAVEESRIADGRVTVLSPDDSCAILVNERETGLIEDLKGAIGRLTAGTAARGRPLVGSSSVVLPVAGGKLRLGTWQRVLLVELGRPSERSVPLQIVGE